MNIRNEIQPIVLRYHEQGWTEKTVACLIAAGFEESDIVFADREGTGNMSKAFNIQAPQGCCQFRFPIWKTERPFRRACADLCDTQGRSLFAQYYSCQVV